MSATRREWARAPVDPDPREDLGYDTLELDVIRAEASDQLLFLPRDDDLLRENAFIVADEAVVLDLCEQV